MRELPPEEWRRALGAIEREVASLEAQRTPEQERWLAAHRPAGYRGTIAGARAITARLHARPK